MRAGRRDAAEPAPARRRWCSPTWSSSASRWTAAAAARCCERGAVRAALARCSGRWPRRLRGVARLWSRLRRPARRARREPAAARARCATLETRAAGAPGSAPRRRRACASSWSCAQCCRCDDRWWPQVIARDGMPWFRTVTINKGGADGVALNAPVISPTGVVGRVIARRARARPRCSSCSTATAGVGVLHRAQPRHRRGLGPGRRAVADAGRVPGDLRDEVRARAGRRGGAATSWSPRARPHLPQGPGDRPRALGERRRGPVQGDPAWRPRRDFDRLEEVLVVRAAACADAGHARDRASEGLLDRRWPSWPPCCCSRR